MLQLRVFGSSTDVCRKLSSRTPQRGRPSTRITVIPAYDRDPLATRTTRRLCATKPTSGLSEASYRGSNPSALAVPNAVIAALTMTATAAAMIQRSRRAVTPRGTDPSSVFDEALWVVQRLPDRRAPFAQRGIRLEAGPGVARRARAGSRALAEQSRRRRRRGHLGHPATGDDLARRRVVADLHRRRLARRGVDGSPPGRPPSITDRRGDAARRRSSDRFRRRVMGHGGAHP